MRIRTSLTVLTAIVAVAALAGCSGSEDGQAAPAPGSAKPSKATGSSGTNSDVPKVNNPVDSSRFNKAPCEALTPQQAKKLSPTSKQGLPDLDSVAGASCSWIDTESGTNLSVSFVTDGNGLKTTYQNHQAGSVELFKEIPDIQGHPAVIASPSDQRSNGSCGVVVGLTDALAMSAGAELDPKSPHHADPCGLAQSIADSAMQTIKAGQ